MGQTEINQPEGEKRKQRLEGWTGSALWGAYPIG